MSKSIGVEELLLNLGLPEAKLSEEELVLSGEGSTLYAAEGETEERRKLFDLENLRYSAEDDTKLQSKLYKSANASDKSGESKKELESAWHCLKTVDIFYQRAIL